MRLLNCHIENFGVLSDFDLEFDPGLTVVCRENGFGKSTLAAFLKTMFYGLPRVGPRNAVENERRRYDPWRGGAYGGSLEFERGGIRYRVARSFGRTASQDTFEITDLTNRRSEVPFTEKLGEELFRLDAESFVRSAYIPQLAVRDAALTTSIRAKLGNLVDHTDDMNNFDTAAESLRRLRAGLLSYRGSGGRLFELEQERRALEEERGEAEAARAPLREASEEIDRLNLERDDLNREAQDLLDQIREASDRQARQMRRVRLDELRAETARLREALRALDDRYPAGLPSKEEIAVQRDRLAAAEQAAQRLRALTLSQEDSETVGRWRALFPDADQAAEDLDVCDRRCRELAETSARLTAQMLPEELERLDELSRRFADGPPTEDELRDGLQAADGLRAARARLSDLTVSREDEADLARLKGFFRAGVPDEETLSGCEVRRHDLEALTGRRAACALPEEDRLALDSLRRTFASGVPAAGEIRDRQADCRRIAELTGIKSARTTRAEKEGASGKGSFAAASVLSGCLGAAALAAGVACFAANRIVPGVLLLSAGFLGLLAALALHVRRIVGGRTGGVSLITASAITDEENQELYDLSRSLTDFLLRFYPDASDPEGLLSRLLLDVERYADLRKREAAARTERARIEREIGERDQWLHRVFDKYYPGAPYRDAFARDLREAVGAYESLNDKVGGVVRERADLEAKAETCRARILSLLRRYGPAEPSVDPCVALRGLSADAAAYAGLTGKRETMLAENACHRAKAEELDRQIRSTLTQYQALDPQQPLGQCLQELRRRLYAYRMTSGRAADFRRNRQETIGQRETAEASVREFLEKYRLSGDIPKDLIERVSDDIRTRADAVVAFKEAEGRLRAFLEEHPEMEQQPDGEEEPEDPPDPEVLREREREVRQRIDSAEKRLSSLRERRDALRRQAERLPDLDDRLTRVEDARRTAERKRVLLDRAMDLLNQAKDNLANRYLDTVERGFQRYADALLGGEVGRALLDKDLKLRVEAQGIPREVGSFSVGTADGLMLCMRLSLVDALFAEEKPFLILDDPFVNLDDAHTERALQILREIAGQYQVLYLVCHSSRK